MEKERIQQWIRENWYELLYGEKKHSTTLFVDLEKHRYVLIELRLPGMQPRYNLKEHELMVRWTNHYYEKGELPVISMVFNKTGFDTVSAEYYKYWKKHLENYKQLARYEQQRQHNS